MNAGIHLRELEENNIRISCRTFVRLQGVMIGAYGLCAYYHNAEAGQKGKQDA